MNISNLAHVDWLIVAIFIISIFMGISRGMIRELLSLIIWVAAVYIIVNYSEAFMHQLPFLAKYNLNVGFKTIIAAIILLILIIIIGGIIRKLIDGLIEFSGLDGTDKTLGAVFGFLRGFIIVLILMTLTLQVFSVEDHEWWKQSLFLPYFLQFQDDTLMILKSIHQFFQ